MNSLASWALAGFLSAAPFAAEALTVFSFSDGGGDGTGEQSVTGDDFALDLTGNDNGANAVYTTFTVTAPSDGAVRFTWLYQTYDSDGASWDRAGYRINGSQVQFTNNAGPDLQSGKLELDLFAGDEFTIYVYSVDGLYGAADLTVEGEFDPTGVPVPGSGLLIGTAVVALGVRRKLRIEALERARTELP